MAGRRIAVAATGPFGADVLERLAAEHDVVRLLTRPDKPRGRGRRIAPPPAKEAAERLGIPVAQPQRLDESVELGADTVVVCGYGVLIPNALLERALWLNVHPSLLPRWRGAAPVERALMAGDEETGVTIHRTVEALDAGPIAARRAFPVSPEDDAGAVYARAAEVAVRLLDERVRAGQAVHGGEVDRAARGVIEAAGYGAAFTHRTGHSIGWLGAHGDGVNIDDFETHDTRLLRSGAAFSIEPGIYLPTFGVRSEINVVITPEGRVQVTTPPQRDLVRLA